MDEWSPFVEVDEFEQRLAAIIAEAIGRLDDVDRVSMRWVDLAVSHTRYRVRGEGRKYQCRWSAR